MADESEKRFHSIMDKLFLAPPNSASSSSKGKKRPNPSSTLALVEPRSSSSLAAEAPVCRPWDRGDLMKRLSTFKSMTWFAKPEVVSALNCARRGWTNVDIDTISCEACGARFLFTTPSAWNQQQVEKAAAVFSLKLDNGHKLLCPWIDNVCEDILSQFPPTSPPILAEKFKERFDSLLRLSALPVISSSAIEYMRSPQFEQFFERTFTMEHGNVSQEVSGSIGEECDAGSEKYYQAQKLIALCGWEPRVVPYVVDTGINQNTTVDVQSARVQELAEANISSEDSKKPQTDPNSVVLDCKLCGASVGLWAFAKAPCPTELIRLVGSIEVNHNGTQNSGTGSDSATPFKDRRQSSIFSIAGGPPPAEQNFKATVSFPIIGRNLRARLCSDSESDNSLVPEQEKAGLGTSGDDCGKDNDNGKKLSVDNVLLLEKEGMNVIDNSNVGNKIGTDDDNGSSLMVLGSDSDLLQISGTSTGHGEELLPFCLEGDVVIDMSALFGPTASDEKATDQEDDQSTLETSVNSQLVSRADAEEDPKKQVPLVQSMHFDPIRQHRHFCPWIASTFKSAPGWKQTLSALLRQKGISPSSDKSPSTSIIKVDDPITSVRNLFVSPSPKRMKRDLLTNASPQS